MVLCSFILDKFRYSADVGKNNTLWQDQNVSCIVEICLLFSIQSNDVLKFSDVNVEDKPLGRIIFQVSRTNICTHC